MRGGLAAAARKWAAAAYAPLIRPFVTTSPKGEGY